VLFRNNKILNLLRLLRRAFGDYKRQIVFLSVFGFFGGVLEGVGINAIIPLFSFLGKSSSPQVDIISQAIQGFFRFFHLPYSLKSILIFIIVIFLSKAVLLFLAKFISARIIADYQRATRHKILRLILLSDWPNLFKQKVGYLDQILITDINYSSAMLAHMSSAILITANLIVYSFVAVNISPVIAALAMISGVVILFLLKPLFYRNKLFSEKIASIYKQTAHFISESIIGIKTIKTSSSENFLIEKGDDFFNHIKKFTVKNAIMQNLTNTLLQPVGLLFVIGIFAFFYKVKGFDFASFAVIVYAINKLFSHIQLAETEAHTLASLTPFVVNVLQYQEEAASHQEIDTGGKKFSFKKEVCFKNVDFSYNSGKKTLSNLNFSIECGRMIGIIGASGAGKTTLVDLLLRLFKPSGGSICVDGIDINEIGLAEWRAGVGYVSQDIFLLNDTIENNIRFYNESISHEDALEAAEMAQCNEFIQKLSQQFMTVVGERGMSLSGGQRQRIALARVLARKPSILVLDEATSALDNESEIMVQRAIEKLRGKITVLVIAHRLSTVMTSDKLVVLEKGRIIEEGAPLDLLKNRESYFSKAYNLK